MRENEEEAAYRRLAWLAANIMNTQLKKPVTPTELLGVSDKYRRDGTPRKTADELQSDFDELRRDLIGGG